MSEYFVGTIGANNQTTFESFTSSEVLDDLQLNTTHSPTFNGLTVSQNVGIGTTSPNSILELASQNPVINFKDTNAGTDLSYRYIQNVDGKFLFAKANDAYNSFTTHMAIDTIGNVGINTTAPTDILTINQTADSSGIRINGYDDESSSYLKIFVDNNGRSRIAQNTDGSSGYLFLEAEDYLQLIAGSFVYTQNEFRIYDAGQLSIGNGADFKIKYDNSTDKLNIHSSTNNGITMDTSGNVGIGTNSPNTKLHVEGNTPVIQIRETSGTAEAGISMNHSVSGNHYNWFLGTLDGSPRKLTIGATVTDGHSTNTAQAAASLMLLDQSTGNVGIGTTSPAAKLDVNGAITNSSGTVRIESVSGQEVEIASTRDIRLLIDSNNDDTTNRFEIQSNTSTSNDSNIVFVVEQDGQTIIDGGVGVASSGTLHLRQKGNSASDGLAITSSHATSHRIWKDASGKLNIGPSSDSDAFVQDLSGNVGIGTSTPSKKLEVTGDIKASATVEAARVHISSDLRHAGDEDTKLNFGTDTINLITAGTTALTVDSSSDVTVNNDLVVSGNFTVNGTTSTINSTTVQVDDKNIELGTVATPTDTTADGGGITLKGATDKTINWVNSTDAWTFSERIAIPYGNQSAPSLTFSSSTNTGIYGSSTFLRLVVGGVWKASIASNGVTSNGFIKEGGSSAEFLKADGSVDSNTYLTTSSASSTYLPLAGGTMTGAIAMGNQNITGGGSFFANLFSVGNEGKVVSTSTLGLQLQATGSQKPIIFSTNDGGMTERMRVHTDGNVGIGTTSPNHKLDIYSNENVPLRIHRPSNANLDSSGAWGIGFSTRGDAVTSTTDTRAGIFSYYNGNLFLAANSTSIVSDPDAYARLTVAAAGNVGIGTTSPSKKLDVVGNAEISQQLLLSSPNYNDHLVIRRGAYGYDTIVTGSRIDYSPTSSTNTFKFLADLKTNSNITADGGIFYSGNSTKLDINQYNAGYLRLLTGNTERVRVTSSGNVGIGTTTPSYKLDVNGTLRATSAAYFNNDVVVTNNLTLTGANKPTFTTPDDTVYTPSNNWVTATPFNAAWHDLTAFDRNYTTTQEVSTDGTNFSSETLELGLFAQKDKVSYDVIGNGERAVRWTWTGVAYNVGRYFHIAAGYSSPTPSCTVKIETSSDGSSWTEIHSSSAISFSASNRFYYVDPYIGNGGHNYVRLTIDKGNTDTKVVRLTSIKMLTQRLGDQGKGREDELPFYYDKNQNIGIGTTTPATPLHVTGEVRVDATEGVAARKIRSNYFSSGQNLDLVCGASASLILGDGTARLTLASDDSATFAGSVTATSLIKSGGSSSEFLKADGSVDSNTYVSSASLSSYLPLAGGTMSGNINLNDDIKVRFGNAQDLELYHSSAGDSYIVNKTGVLDIRNTVHGGDIKLQAENSSGTLQEYFRVDGGVGLNIFYKDSFYGDGRKAIFGDNNDLQIYHNGSASYIDDTGTGNLFVRANAQFVVQKYTGETLFKGIADGAVELYHNNVKKFETTSNGVSVTGNVLASNNVYAAGSNGFVFGSSTSEGEYIYRSGNDIRVLAGGADRLTVDGDAGNVGIGTTSPATKLHILTSNEGAKTTYADVAIEAVDAQLDLTSSSSGSWGSAINFVEGASTSANTDIWSIARQTTGGSGDSSLRFNFGTSNQHDNDSKITFTSSGDVTVSGDLTVNGTISGQLTKKISGDGSATTFTVTHSFGTPHVMTQLLDYGDNGTGATYEVVQATVKRNSDNAIDVLFGVAPTSSEDYLVLITKMPAIS